MSNLPRYYFQDIPAAVMHEIMQGMQQALPEPTWEEIDHWLDCNNRPATIPAWYDRAEEIRNKTYFPSPFSVLQDHNLRGLPLRRAVPTEGAGNAHSRRSGTLLS
jgi:hypothetical protein